MSTEGHSSPRPEVGRFAKVFGSRLGFTVTLLRFQDQALGQFLLWFEGIDHAFNQKIFLCHSKPGGTGLDYEIQIEGKPHTVLIMRNSYGYEAFQAKPFDAPDFVQVIYDEGLSRYVVPEHSLTAFLQQT